MIRFAPWVCVLCVCVSLAACGKLVGIRDIDFEPNVEEAGPETNADARAEAGTDGAVDASADMVAEPSEEAGPEITAPDAASDAGDERPPACDSAALGWDKHHCGRCGHDCLGGDCRNGACDPVKIATQLHVPGAIAASSDGYVYWLDEFDGTVRRASKVDPKSPQFLGQSDPVGIDIAVDDQFIYYTTYTPPDSTVGGGINRLRKDGVGGVEILNSSFTGVQGLVLDDTYAFYAVSSNPTMIIRMRKDGSDTNRIHVAFADDAGQSPSVFALAVDDRFVYATDMGSNTVIRVQKDADLAQDRAGVFVRTRPRPSSVRVDGDFVYWADSVAIYRRSRIDVSADPELLSEASHVSMIAVDATHVYFAENHVLVNGGASGSIGRIKKDAPSSSILGRDLTSGWGPIGHIAIDETAVYFTSADEVVKIAK
jgi:hypothetical protein